MLEFFQCMNNGQILVAMQIMKKQKNNKTPIEILVIGSGNIAIRHIKNIKNIFPNKIIYVLKRTNIQLDKFFYGKNIVVIKDKTSF